ncbi:MAG: UDP-3-O-(3-hydroxymyristoyl)glucosamine N-acyltransferase [bacterium]
MPIKITHIAEKCKGELVGDLDAVVSALAKHPTIAMPSELALIFSDVPSQALKMMKESKADNLLISESLVLDETCKKYIEENEHKNFILTARPRFSLQQVIKLFDTRSLKDKAEISELSQVAKSAQLAKGVSVGAFSSIGEKVSVGKNTLIHDRVSIANNVSIGEDCVIYPGVVIYENTKIANRVIIHANSVLGSDGYSFVTAEPSNVEKLQSRDFNFNMGRQIQEKIESIGGLVIDNDVEIGACTTIDRGTIGETFIGEGTKIDNQCQIAHNVYIGKDCLIVSQVGIAGSTEISDRVVVAGACGLADGIKVGNDVVVGAMSGVHGDLDPYLPVMGIPAIPYGEYMSRQKAFARLPKLIQEFKELKKELADKFKKS